MGEDVGAEELGRKKLFAAAWRGVYEDVRDLIDSGSAGVNAADSGNVTALRFAAQYGHYEIAEYLLTKGADPNSKAHDGYDPILAAIDKGHKDVVTLLLQNGADPNSRNKFTNALLLAEEKGHQELARIIESNGGNREISVCMRVRRTLKEPKLRCSLL